MKCKYDETHTEEFPNAVRLQQHYIAEHSDVYTKPVKKPAKAVTKRNGHTPKGLSADDIVIPVMTSLLGEEAARRLQVILNWREATKQMIKDLKT